jgi:hypothetical protein
LHSIFARQGWRTQFYDMGVTETEDVRDEDDMNL